MTKSIGFIGLGVMGEPICRNLARKSGVAVCGFDLVDAPFARLENVERVSALADIASRSDTIFMALPSGRHVESVCAGQGGLLTTARAGQIVVDLGTTSVETTRALAEQFANAGAFFVDAPIARTRQAAEDGTLSVMVGADAALFERLKPLMATFATDITHCGSVGSGQVVKILNNMVLMQTVVALAEALETAKRAGLDPAVLFDAFSKGSADSFALRNHGMKAMLPDVFPERAFSARYAQKDMGYAIDLARTGGLRLKGAELADALLQKAIERGLGDKYWPVLSHVISAE